MVDTYKNNSADSVKQVRNSEGHYPNCSWADPHVTSGPDTCRCTMEQIRNKITTSTDSDTGSDSSSNISIKCANCNCHVVNIGKILNSVLRLCDIMTLLIDKCK